MQIIGTIIVVVTVIVILTIIVLAVKSLKWKDL